MCVGMRGRCVRVCVGRSACYVHGVDSAGRVVVKCLRLFRQHVMVECGSMRLLVLASSLACLLAAAVSACWKFCPNFRTHIPASVITDDTKSHLPQSHSY